MEQFLAIPMNSGLCYLSESWAWYRPPHTEKSEPILRPWQYHKACILFTSFGWNEIILNCLGQIIKRKREKSIFWDNLSAKVILHNGLSIWHMNQFKEILLPWLQGVLILLPYHHNTKKINRICKIFKKLKGYWYSSKHLSKFTFNGLLFKYFW